jgi:uncharacterized membrane protein
MLRKISFVLLLALLTPAQGLAAPDAKPTAKVETKAATPAPTPAPVVKTEGKVEMAKAEPKDEPKAAPKSTAGPTSLPVVDPDDPGSIIKFIFQAVKESKWAWLVGLLIMFLTWVFNKLLKEKIPAKVLPWVAIGLGVATNVAMSFASGLIWYEAIANGVSLGLAAAGGWSAIGKYIFPTKAGTEAKPT